ncbi:Dirigent protein 23 [Vitis vinifera]|uniref:Dirigent protein n=1 Tax=Vitis vinifera TaxID=29760 RepID=A0A438DTV8_VITVI|nr:Dirigent protein 23 [Vitis vinifera]
MAPTSLRASATISFLLLLAISICLEAKPLKLKQTQVVFYMHDWETGANVTAIPIAGLPKKPWAVGTFATIIAIDDALTETIDRNSAQIGRAQGIYVNSALDGSDLHFLMSVVFTNKQYNGSSLEIQGANRFFNKYREVSVVSGTGMFRLARGYAILETVYLDLPVSNAIIRWNVTVLHY